jgi:hypothetical protein
LFICWANAHGGVLAGIGTAGLCLVGWCIGWALGGESPVSRPRDAVETAALLASLAGATLLNPYGWKLPLDWFRTLSLPLQGIIEEHAPLNLGEPTAWATVALAAAYLMVLAGTFPRRPRITWLLPLVWFVMAIARVRNAPLLAVTVALAMADLLPHSRVGRWLARRGMLSSSRAPAGWRAAVLPLVVVVLSAAIQVSGVCVPVVGRGWARLDPARWPVELLPKLSQISQTNAEGARIFNDLQFGGFLIYYAPRLKVFVDDRCSLYGGEFLESYEHARLKDAAQLDHWQQQYGFDYALVQADGNFDRHLSASASWAALGRTPAAALYQRRMGTPPIAR